MPSDSLLPLLDALLRLRSLSPDELESLIRQLPSDTPDPKIAAQQLLQRGWITAEQFASLVPAPSPFPQPSLEQAPSEQPPARETILVGFGDDDAPLDPETAGADQWSLPTEEEPTPPAPQPAADSSANSSEAISFVVPTLPEPLPPMDTEPKEDVAWDAVAESATQTKPPIREDATDQRMRQMMAWSGKGLLVWLLFVGSFFFGAWFLRPAPQLQSEQKPASRTSKATQPAVANSGERWWESKVLDADAVAAEHAKSKAASGDAGRPPPKNGPSTAPQTKGQAPPAADPDKPPPLPRPKLPAGSVWLGQEDDPQVTAIAFRDNHVVATGNQEGRLFFWDTEKGTSLESWVGHKDRVNRIVFSEAGRCMASVGGDGLVRVWNGMSHHEIYSWQADALSLAICKDGRYVAAGCADGLVRVTDLRNGQKWSFPKEPAKGNPRSTPAPLCLAFGPDNTTLASGYGGGYILVFDAASRKQTHRFVGQRSSSVYAIAFSPDGRTLASAGKDGAIKLWDMASGKEVRTIAVPGNQAVQTLDYSPRSPYLAAGSWDGAVHLWNLGLIGQIKLIKTIQLPPAGFGQQIDLSPDGRLLGCVHGGNSACVIPLPP